MISKTVESRRGAEGIVQNTLFLV
jgi:hypothetical protein